MSAQWLGILCAPEQTKTKQIEIEIERGGLIQAAPFLVFGIKAFGAGRLEA